MLCSSCRVAPAAVSRCPPHRIYSCRHREIPTTHHLSGLCPGPCPQHPAVHDGLGTMLKPGGDSSCSRLLPLSSFSQVQFKVPRERCFFTTQQILQAPDKAIPRSSKNPEVCLHNSKCTYSIISPFNLLSYFACWDLKYKCKPWLCCVPYAGLKWVFDYKSNEL